MKELKAFIAATLRPFFGYHYKVVYTELEVNGTFKRRFMCKLKIDDDNLKITKGLPKVNGAGYITPRVLFYSKTNKNLNKRIRMLKTDATGNLYNTHFK
jgi:hypothetical protein